MITVSSSTPYWLPALAVGIGNVGAGVIAPAMTAALVDDVGPEQANMAGSVLNANRQLGTLMGVAAMSVVLGSISDWGRGQAVSFLIIGIAYLSAAAGAWRLVMRAERLEAATTAEATAQGAARV